MEFIDNKINLRFCSDSYTHDGSVTEDEGQELCRRYGGNGNKYDGPIYSNELDSCTAVYINGERQNEVDPSCNPVIDNDETNEPSQIVNVPATSAYASIVIIVLGIVCVIISIIVTRRVTKKS